MNTVYGSLSIMADNIIGTALSVSLPVYGAQWKQDSTGWWYEQDNSRRLGADFWKLVLF